LEQIGSNPALFFSLQLAILLGMAERSGDELSLRETLLGIHPDDYADRSRLRRRLGSRLPDVDPELWGLQIHMLAATLGKLSRRAETIAVVEAALGLEPSDYSAPGLIREKIQTLLGPVPGELAEGFLTLPALAAVYLGRRSEAAAFLEACLGLSPEDYRNPPQLAAKLRERASRRAPESLLFPTVVVLLNLLTTLRRAEDAAALLIADLGLETTKEAEPREVAGRFRQRAKNLSPVHSAFYRTAAAGVMTKAGHARTGIAILVADTEMEALDWNDVAGLSAALARHLAPLFPSARGMYVAILSDALFREGREDQAALLIDAFLQGLSPLEGEAPFMACTFSVIAANWLGCWWRDADRSPWVACRSFVRFLRHSLAEQGATLQDREDFIRAISELRRRLIQTGIYWAARETDGARAGELRRTVLLWDLELSQRLILERFRLTEIHPAAAAEAPEPGAWPLREPPPAVEGYLPQWGVDQAVAGVLGSGEPGAR
jgi:hypothetical protein